QFTGLFNMLEEINRRNSDDTPILEDFRTKAICPTCDGARLKKESLHFKIDQKNISELASMDITTLHNWFQDIESRLNDRQNTIATEILKEIRARIGFLLDVGLSYLTLDRASKTLSRSEEHTSELQSRENLV